MGVLSMRALLVIAAGLTHLAGCGGGDYSQADQGAGGGRSATAPDASRGIPPRDAGAPDRDAGAPDRDAGPAPIGPAPTCADRVRNGTETGIDCGGGGCPACDIGGTCAGGADCTTGACNAGVCQVSLVSGIRRLTGALMEALQYIDDDHVYAIGMDRAIWRFTTANAPPVRLTQGNVKDAFTLVGKSESNILAIGMDNGLWRWDGATWTRVAGSLTDALQYVDDNHVYGLGLDGAIWRFTVAGAPPVRVTEGTVQQAFWLVGNSEANILAIGLDNGLWRWDGATWTRLTGLMMQAMRYVDDRHVYGIGLDKTLWRFSTDGTERARVTDSAMMSDFILAGSSERKILGIGLDNSLWAFGW